MLERAAGPDRTPQPPLAARHAGGLVALGAGLVSLVIAAFMQFGGKREITEPPDPWFTVPLLVLALAGVGAMFVRKERHRALGFVGVGLAVSAVALGWVLVGAAVGAGALLVCLILAKFL
jgi:hypothetical protein